MRTATIAIILTLASSLPAQSLRFSREVLPLLSDKCFACHGPDGAKREADLRLDTREGVLAVVSLEKPADSELLSRVRPDAAADRLMPPPDSHKPALTAAQIATLERWIAEGAPWGKHWSLELPRQIQAPPAGMHPIDYFIRSRLKAAGLEPSPPAAATTLLRRIALDITGLPPTAEEVEDFAADYAINVESALNTEIDRLLASPRFGERMAMWWLDAARYADTDGFQGDETRTNWPWRDWVVEAFNSNMPFDEFTVQQFAGDLLPEATPEQRLATCFHRNHMTNGEGGRDPEESRIDYVIDRVNSMGTIWLGLTLGCCQCHSHKYDPITQTDYYSLAAFFDSVDEDGKAGRNAKPYLAYRSPWADAAVSEMGQLVEKRKLAEATARGDAEQPFQDWLIGKIDEVSGGHESWQMLQPSSLESAEGTVLLVDDGVIVATGPNPVQDDYRVTFDLSLPRLTGVRLEVLADAKHSRARLFTSALGEFILTDIKFQVARTGSSQVRDLIVATAVADASAEQKEARSYGDIKGVLDDDPRNGWTTKGLESTAVRTAVFAFSEPLRLAEDEQLVVELRQRSTQGDANIGRFRLAATGEAGAAVTRVGTTPLERLSKMKSAAEEVLGQELRNELFDQFLADYGPYQRVKRALASAEKQHQELLTASKDVNVMVLAERDAPRSTHVLLRGVWDKKGDLVQKDFPAAIAPWLEATADKGKRSRVDLAKWLVSAENPLTARVIVNHLWQMQFGSGLVRTADDFGLQGELPTHPELLDWLAIDFMQHNWDVKYLIRLMMTSQTYQQSSYASPELLSVDPENRLLARAGRYRLPAWMLRDAALKYAGLLNAASGGPPVRPYQPAGVWEEMFMGRFTYEPSEGAAQYRRTLYAFWRRAISPTFLFDSPQRRTCEVRVARTNTPLQALTMLNDANYLVAAFALATSTQQRPGTAVERLEWLFQRVVLRKPTTSELQVLNDEYLRAHQYYAAHPEQATALIAQIQPDGLICSEDSVEQASYTLVASLILNLDETLNRE